MFGAILGAAIPVVVQAESQTDRCRIIAASVVAEMKTASSKPMSAEALSAASIGARRGCMAFSDTSSTEVPTGGPLKAAEVTSSTGSKSDGFFAIFTGDPKRTAGNKRLQKRGK